MGLRNRMAALPQRHLRAREGHHGTRQLELHRHFAPGLDRREPGRVEQLVERLAEEPIELVDEFVTCDHVESGVPIGSAAIVDQAALDRSEVEFAWDVRASLLEERPCEWEQ